MRAWGASIQEHPNSDSEREVATRGNKSRLPGGRDTLGDIGNSTSNHTVHYWRWNETVQLPAYVSPISTIHILQDYNYVASSSNPLSMTASLIFKGPITHGQEITRDPSHKPAQS